MEIDVAFLSWDFYSLTFVVLFLDSLASVLYLTTSMMMMPIFGIVVDRYGPRTNSCFGFVLSVTPHLFLWILTKCRTFEHEVYLILSLLFVGGKHPVRGGGGRAPPLPSFLSPNGTWTKGVPSLWTYRHLWKHNLPSYYVRRRHSQLIVKQNLRVVLSVAITNWNEKR